MTILHSETTPVDFRTKRARTLMPIMDVLATRWSTRSFDPDQDIPKDKLVAVAEAARWAPSTNNNQPWRYIFFDRNNENRTIAEAALAEGNFWAKRAACLIAAVHRDSYEKDSEKANPWAALELGLSLSNLMHQAVAEGLAVHPIAGFDEKYLIDRLGIPTGYHVPVMVVLGHYKPFSGLKEWQIESEYKVRERKALDSVANFAGIFSQNF